MISVSLSIISADQTSNALLLVNPTLVIAGFTGRDAEAVNRHIRELQAHGIEAPDSFPMFWTLPNWLLITAQSGIQAQANHTCGEVEPVLIRMPNGDLFVTVGSDHTDRTLEASSILLSKLTCPKILAPNVWRYTDVVDRWDTLHVQARIGAQASVYQDGTLALIRQPLELLALARSHESSTEQPLILFLGTIPLQTDGFRFTERFIGSLEDTTTGTSLLCEYSITQLSGPRAS
jgi:hypothetical protein